MRILRAQYFLAFAVIGSLTPFIPIYLAQKNLTEPQIGYISGVASFSVVLAPVLIALLADTRFDARHLISILFVGNAVMLVLLRKVETFWPMLFVFLLQNIAHKPIIPLEDGVNFTIAQRRQKAGLKPAPYHHVRIFGSIGFIAPSLFLFWMLRQTTSLDATLYCAITFSLIGAVNALFLPPSARHAVHELARDAPPIASTISRRSSPLADALRALRRPPLPLFCVIMFLLNMAACAYYTYYPIYLRSLGIERKWIGLISMIGVTVELPFMLFFGRLERIFGTRRLMIAALVAISIRLILLATIPTRPVGILTQLFHGMQVTVLMIWPPVFINRHAADHYRHSMQGVYTMLITGLGQIAGGFLAGRIAWFTGGRYWVFIAAAIQCVLAAVLLLMFFPREKTDEKKSPTSEALETIGAEP